MKRILKNYQALPYSRRAERIHEDDGSSYWVAWIHELPGCKTDGATQAKAMLNLGAAFDDYIEAMIEFETDILVPKGRSKPKSKDDPFYEIIWNRIPDRPKVSLGRKLSVPSRSLEMIGPLSIKPKPPLMKPTTPTLLSWKSSGSHQKSLREGEKNH